MDTVNVVRLGLDPGFGNVTCAIAGDNPITVTESSVVGIGSMEVGAIHMFGVTKARRTDTPTVVGFDGIEYLVGYGVATHARPIERMDFNRFSDTPELRALIYSVIGRAVGGDASVAIAIGLPVEVLQDKSLAATVESEMAWLKGNHVFCVNGRRFDIKVLDIKVNIAQPLATWFNWGLDDLGRWARSAAEAKAPSLVIDLGFNTLDIIAIEGGRISSRYTGGETLGMRRASEVLLDLLGRKYNISMSLHEADELIQSLVNRRSVTVYVNGKLVNVESEARQAINTLESMVMRFIDSKVDEATRFNVILTGGGVLAIGSSIMNRYPATIIDNPLESNAIGLAKLAQRANVFNLS